MTLCVVTLVIALLIVATGCERGGGQGKAAAQQAESFAPQVHVAPAVAHDVPVYIDQIGRVAARESVSVVPQVAGKVIAAHFVEGTDVKKGDLLFEIDPRPFQAALGQADAAVNSARVNVTWAKQQWDNVQNLQDAKGAVSKEEIQQRQNGVATAEAQLKSAEAALETAKLNLEYCSIKSPIDGRTGQRLIDPGNVVKANEGTLVTIQKLDPVYVDFTVTEQEMIDVRKSMSAGSLTVEATIPGEQAAGPATSPAAEAASPVRSGTLTFLDNAVQPGTGTIKLRATLANADHYFWPQQFVNVRLVLSVKKDAVLVPQVAEQFGQQGPFVFVVNDAEVPDQQTGEKKKATVAEMRPIKPGQKQGDMLVVESGLAVGERVVTIGQMMVQPGAPVAIAQPPQQQPPQQQQGQKSPT